MRPSTADTVATGAGVVTLVAGTALLGPRRAGARAPVLIGAAIAGITVGDVVACRALRAAGR